MIKVSTIIPTRNRVESLNRCLKSISAQKSLPDEVIIVDASDMELNIEKLSIEFSQISIQYIRSSPSVCKQRNTGIAIAKHDWIFLCDDDIELPDDYLLILKTFLEKNDQCNAVAGILKQYENGEWVDQYPPKSQMEVLWRFIFQLSIWGDLGKIKFSPPLQLVKKWYAKCSNGVSHAGWPIITEWQQDPFNTSIYPLGASIVRKKWLVNSPFDTVLDPYGIGDNYGVALNFPQPNSIHVLSSTFASHHRNPENRLNKSLSYYRRVLALHYFFKRKENSLSRSFWFVWSLFGNLILFIIKGDKEMWKATSVAISKIILGKNPYWKGHLLKDECVEPKF